MAGPIGSFYANVGISTRIQDLQKVDRYLRLLETKLKRFDNLFSQNFSLGISRFFVNEQNLKRTLGNALDKASKDVVFEISRFAVNERNLRAAMLRAGRSFAREAVPYQAGPQTQGSTVRERPQLADKSGRNYMYGGGTAGAIARYGIGSMPFIGGAYGLMQLNTANQEAISTRLTTQAVLQSQGYTEQQGEQAFQWLRNLGNINGFSYMQAAPDYNQFLSNSLGAGVSLSGSQDIFRGFTEYQTAMGVTPARRKLVNNALSQMMGKGVLSMEEVRRQMAESLPGTMSIFAEALARQTGSGLTGQAAIAALYEAIPKGNVSSADILPIVAEIMRERAEPKIGALRKTSMAEQERLGNALQDLVKVFSDAGGEEGFARFFRNLTDTMTRLTPVVEGLGKAFNWFSKQLGGPLTLMGDLGYMFKTTSQTLGEFKTNLDDIHPSIAKLAGLGALMMTKWGRIATMFYGIYLVLEDIAVGVMGGESLTGKFFTFLEKFVEFDKGIMGVAMAFLAVAAAIKLTATVAKASLLGKVLQDSLPGGTPDAPGKKGSKGLIRKTLSVGKWFAGPALLASYWGMNSEEFQARMAQDSSFRDIVNQTLAPLKPGFEAIGNLTGADPRLRNMTEAQKAEYHSGKSKPGKQGMWEDLDGYLNYKSSKDAQWKLDNQHLSDIPSIPTVETALGQAMQQPMNNTNNITNTFEINIDGVLDPSGLEGVMTNQIIPQFEIFFNNQLQLVDTSFGSK